MNRILHKICWVLLFLTAAGGALAESVINSPHNLSIYGPGNIKAANETDACIFCHAMHKTTPKTPLWNHGVSGATYTPYTSTTTKAVIGQPTGSSKLCLSCHDGTVALGMVGERVNGVKMKNGLTTMPKGKSNLGTDLSGHHPISFTYDAALAARDAALQNPATLKNKVKLDATQQMQCTSCHNPHDNQFGSFLVQANDNSALCVNCHSLKSWSGSAHSTSSATWNGQGQNPWPDTKMKTVAANGCENCHTPHAAGTKPRLLTATSLENSCYVCHGGTVAKQNIKAEFAKFSAHPVELTSSLHDAAEDPINAPRHVSCVDCHDPHSSATAAPAGTARVKMAFGSAPATTTLSGVKGMNASGTIVSSVTREYELCFRCHADSRDRARSSVPRQVPQTNKRMQFAPGNASFHPIETIGKNGVVPSLISPYTSSSVISCTDCHNSDSGPAAGRNGPAGPHGSIYAPLLEREQVLTDFSPESSATYALCYKCHSRTSLLSNQSFPGHYNHIVNYKTACTTCHDSHGVAASPGLINFNTTYVQPVSVGSAMKYTRAGLNSGNCTLTCHGSAHVNRGYGTGAALLRRRPGGRLPGGF